MPALLAQHLDFERGTFRLAIDRLEIQPGTCVGLVGSNGAGKTTLLDILGGRLACPGASLLLDTVPLDDFGIYRSLAVGTVPDHLVGIGTMSVAEHLRLRATVHPWWDSGYADRLIGRLEIPRETSLKALSKGTAAKLAFVSVEAFRPPILLLDEPTSGLDPVVRAELRDVIVEALQERPTRAMVFSTHLVEDLEAIVDRVLVLRAGEMVADRSISRHVAKVERRAVMEECLALLTRPASERVRS